MGRSVSTPMANTTQSMTRCDNLQARCPARPVSNKACSITAGEITLLRPTSRSTTVSASGVGSKQLPCRAIIIASLEPGSYTHPRLQEAMTCAKTNGIGLSAVYFRVAGANNSIVRDARVLLASHWSRWRPTMRPYSMDLRERVAAAIDAGEGSQRQVAKRFRVSVSFVTRLVQRRRDAGTLAPKPHGGGPRPALGFPERVRLAMRIAEHPDATLKQLKEWGGFACTLTTLWRTLRRFRLTYKKKTLHAGERDT